MNKYLYILLTYLTAILEVASANAGGVSNDASLIQLNNRTFDLRSDVTNLRRDDHFIPLTEITWLRNFTDQDQYLEPLVVHIRLKPQSIFDTWPSITPDKYYPLTENIPEKFVLDGYQTRSSHPSNRMLLLLPLDDPFDFRVRCIGSSTDADINKRAFCSVSASYPPDPNIYLLARIYDAKPPFNFKEIAYRMREVAYCLDVSEQVKHGKYKVAPYIDPGGELPKLKNCN